MSKKLVRRFITEIYEIDVPYTVEIDKVSIKEELAVEFKKMTEEQKRKHLQKLLDTKQAKFNEYIKKNNN